MREKPMGRTLVLSSLLLATLIFANGCQSTSALPASLTHGVAEPGPERGMEHKSSFGPRITAAEIPRKKTTYPLAAALGLDKTAKPNDMVRPVAHNSLPVIKDAPGPYPELMPREDPDPIGLTQPLLPRHAHRHSNKMTSLVAPHAPNESSPVALPTYTIRPPDVLIIESRKGLTTQPIQGQHLVRPDGTVGLGAYPPAYVAGMTLQQARAEIAKAIHSKMAREPYEIEDPPGSGKKIKIKPPTEDEVREGLSVDVLAYNSSVYYVITDGAGLGEQVYRFPVTGSETVLDAISNINGLPLVASPRRIWVARRNEGMGGVYSTFPVDWKGITQQGAMNTNWQVMPGDRIYVQADPVRRFNVTLGKFLEPIERIMGATLLTGQTVNTIRNGSNGFNNNNGLR